MKKFYSLLLLSIMALMPQFASADPDLSGYVLIKSLDFTTNTYSSDPTLVRSEEKLDITAYETGNGKQQTIYDCTQPAELSGTIAFQAVKDKDGKGWWLRASKGGLWSYNAARSAAVYNLKKDYLVVFTCTANNVMTLKNGKGEPDGNFTYETSEDGKTYYCTMTEDGYIGFCGNKSKGYIKSINIYASGDVLIQPSAAYTKVDGKSRTVVFSGSKLAYNTDGSDNYTYTEENTLEVTVSEPTTYYVVSTKEGEVSERLEFTIEAGEEIAVADPTYTITAIAEGYDRTYKLACDNSHVLLNPTVTFKYVFTGNNGVSFEGVAENGTLKANLSGVYEVSAVAEGYLPKSFTIDNSKRLELTKSIDFATLSASTLSSNWKLLAENVSLPGSSSQWPAYYKDVTVNDYSYDFTSETASETDIIPGLIVEFNKDGKTPKFYEGFGFMYPIYFLDAAGADNKSAGAITSGNISIAEGTAEQYAVYTYINNYSKNGTKTTIQAADQPYALYRFSDMLTKVEVYTPVEEVIITSETATINFKEMADEPVSSSSSNAGDITEERTFNVGSSSLLVTPSNATTPNRFWSTSTGPQLRVYGGYLVVTAPEGKAVTNVSINQGKWNSSNTFNGEASATSEWTGNSTNLMIGIAANTQINSITVTTDAATDATTTYVPTVTSINAVKALPLETEVKFELNSVKTTLWSARAWTMYSYIEDATGAMAADMNISNFLYDLIPFGTDIDEGADVRMEGTLWATRSKDSNGIPTLTLSEKTGTDSQVSFTQIEIEPSEAAVATVLKDSANNFRNYLCKYISFSNVTLSKQVVDEYTTNYYIVSGEDSILMYDQYWQLPTIIPDYESIEKIPGFVGIGWDGTFEFHPYGKIEGTLKPAVQVESIGALKQLDDMSNVTLTLNNAQIKVYAAGWWSSEVFIEDETGGIKVDQTIIDLFPDYFDKAGRTFTGELNCYYMNEYGSRYISVNELTTAQSELTVGEAEVVPTTVTLAEAVTAPYEGRLVTIEAPEVTTDEEGYTLFITQGETKVQIMDKFNAIPVDDNWNYVLYDKVKSATGLVIESAGEILFLPYGENAFVEDTATGINELKNSNDANQPLFNLRGMKVQNTKGLKGLYIQNGKKVMFK